jgi:hypothetical protein
MAGRKHVLQAVKKLGLNVPTTELLHRGDYCNAFDHIAVPTNWQVTDAKRICAKDAKNVSGLSDHDAYVIEVREQ